MDFNALEYRFDINDPRWKGYLYENSFVVLKGVVSQEQTTDYLNRMWCDIEELSGNKVNRNITATRTRASNYPYMMHGGMIQYMGHSQLQWDIREVCAPVFANLYNVSIENLSTSFDGLCFMDGVRKYQQRSDIDFLHVDQSPKKQYQYSIQGLLNLVDSGPADGGFVCVPGSHKYTEFWEGKEIPATSKDWYLFTAADKVSDPMFEESIKVCCAAGDFVLWDSRAWHCNTVPTSQNIRACTYVCMLPKKNVPNKIKIQRKQAIQDGRVSNHHPGTGFHLFPKKPQWCGDETYAKAVAIQQRAVLTPLQKRLADLE
ncbi:Phytanoyl-CoA dioxygenase [Pacmanvirus A23]|uniref:Phytanoyl-CoA dioxygenase n=1 Tax=Pacmanvirus A23 TaxID=1932881 RepID=UPI000A095536|nr:Phytanoyl-CoA dioxygenase [Pacmanvirus A23]SIP85920.1 Phytanoyl-CoA dioxygenase [Pacmanvirus A23]